MTTLFLGDLSIYCEEKDLFELCRKYGPIESVQIKRSDDGKVRKPHLSYGFVRYLMIESAQHAQRTLNGLVFLGRPLRIGWASSNGNERNNPFFRTVKSPTAQVHFSFLCPLASYPVTEEQLRFYFEVYGNVLDVTINRVEINRDQGIHTAYGFIHYELSAKGVNSAFAAIQAFHQKSVDSIAFTCTASHGLMNYMRNPGNERNQTNHQPFQQQPIPRSYHSHPLPPLMMISSTVPSDLIPPPPLAIPPAPGLTHIVHGSNNHQLSDHNNGNSGKTSRSSTMSSYGGGSSNHSSPSNATGRGSMSSTTTPTATPGTVFNQDMFFAQRTSSLPSPPGVVVPASPASSKGLLDASAFPMYSPAPVFSSQNRGGHPQEHAYFSQWK